MAAAREQKRRLKPQIKLMCTQVTSGLTQGLGVGVSLSLGSSAALEHLNNS